MSSNRPFHAKSVREMGRPGLELLYDRGRWQLVGKGNKKEKACRMPKNSTLPEPNDVLYRIKRGLAGHVSYLAACEMNEAFSEYILYEPIVRILTARGYTVESEVSCPGVQQPKIGDKKKIDFVACRSKKLTCAIEVKWARSERITIDCDLEKLSGCLSAKPTWKAFLRVFGRKSHITGLRLPKELREQGAHSDRRFPQDPLRMPGV